MSVRNSSRLLAAEDNQTFFTAFGLLWLSWSWVFSFAYSPFGSKTICPVRRGVVLQRKANTDFRIIFVVLDFPVRVIPNRAVFCPSRSVGVKLTGTPEICWNGLFVDAYRTSPIFTRRFLSSDLLSLG